MTTPSPLTPALVTRRAPDPQQALAALNRGNAVRARRTVTRRALRTGALTLAQALNGTHDELDDVSLFDVVGNCLASKRGAQTPGRTSRMALLNQLALRDGINLAMPVRHTSPQTRDWANTHIVLISKQPARSLDRVVAAAQTEDLSTLAELTAPRRLRSGALHAAAGARAEVATAARETAVAAADARVEVAMQAAAQATREADIAAVLIAAIAAHRHDVRSDSAPAEAFAMADDRLYETCERATGVKLSRVRQPTPAYAATARELAA